MVHHREAEGMSGGKLIRGEPGQQTLTNDEATFFFYRYDR